MGEKEVQMFLNQVREVAKQQVQETLKTYVKIIPAVVSSVSNGMATVSLISGGGSFTIPIVTSQTISAGDTVNLAFWGNLSTAIVLSK